MPSLVEIVEASRVAGVPITPQATILIKTILDAITEDPNPRWRSKETKGAFPEFREMRNVQSDMTRRLPDILSDVRRVEGSSEAQGINTFDILH